MAYTQHQRHRWEHRRRRRKVSCLSSSTSPFSSWCMAVLINVWQSFTGVEAWAVSLLLWRLWHQPPRSNQFGSQSRVSQIPILTYCYGFMLIFPICFNEIFAHHHETPFSLCIEPFALYETIFLKLCVLAEASCVQATTTLKTRKLSSHFWACFPCYNSWCWRPRHL